MLELCAIASGSSGNCICVGDDNTHVLIDAGISGKRIENGLHEFDFRLPVSPDNRTRSLLQNYPDKIVSWRVA